MIGAVGIRVLAMMSTTTCRALCLSLLFAVIAWPWPNSSTSPQRPAGATTRLLADRSAVARGWNPWTPPAWVFPIAGPSSEHQRSLTQARDLEAAGSDEEAFIKYV